MEARGIRLQGERGISRQPIAQGMPECSGCTCMLVCASIYILHTRPRVQQAPGIPCSLSFEGRIFLASLGRNLRRENANARSAVIVREGGRSSIPEAAVIESRSRGVLDTRMRGHDSFTVIASEAKQSIYPRAETWIASLRSQ